MITSLLYAGQKSDIQMRQRRRDALKEADVIILAGAVCDFRLSYGRTLGRKAKIIAVNRNKEQLYRVCFTFLFSRLLYGLCDDLVERIGFRERPEKGI